MERYIYWAHVAIADSGKYVQITEKEFADIVAIANKGYGSSFKYDDENKLAKYYAKTSDGRNELVCFRQILK